MYELELLQTMRPIWLQRALPALAAGSGLREDFKQELDHFYSLLETVIQTGDPAWLDSILALWATSLTATDLEDQVGILNQILRSLMQVTYNVVRETLDDSQAVNLFGTLIRPFTYAFEKAAQFEIQVRIAHLTVQLEEVQQTLEKLDRSKSDFIAVAAHELKTPLTLIEGYAAMLREASIKENGGPDAQVHLTGIMNGVNRLRTIVDDMIDVSLIDNNLMNLNLQPVWLSRLFDVLEDEFQPSIQARSQTLQIQSFPGSEELIFADSERLLQLFRNLLTNAIKFTPDYGKVEISGRKLPGFIEIVISDTGIGIAPEDQAAIFEKFSRLGNVALHSSGKTKFKGGGPGLGLHIAKGIVEAHGGAIWVESRGYDENQLYGTSFHILLPIVKEPTDEKMKKLFAPLLKDQSTPIQSESPP